MWCCSAVVKTIRKTSNSCFQVGEKKVLLFGSTRFAPLLTFTFLFSLRISNLLVCIVRCRDFVPVFVGLESCVCPPSRDGWTGPLIISQLGLSRAAPPWELTVCRCRSVPSFYPRLLLTQIRRSSSAAARLLAFKKMKSTWAGKGRIDSHVEWKN